MYIADLNIRQFFGKPEPRGANQDFLRQPSLPETICTDLFRSRRLSDLQVADCGSAQDRTPSLGLMQPSRPPTVGRQQESMRVPIDRTYSRNVTGQINRTSIYQQPTGLRWSDPIIEINHAHIAAPHKGVSCAARKPSILPKKTHDGYSIAESELPTHLTKLVHCSGVTPHPTK